MRAGSGTRPDRGQSNYGLRSDLAFALLLSLNTERPLFSTGASSSAYLWFIALVDQVMRFADPDVVGASNPAHGTRWRGLGRGRAVVGSCVNRGWQYGRTRESQSRRSYVRTRITVAGSAYGGGNFVLYLRSLH